MPTEQFFQFADLLPEAMLLVSGDGTLLAANRSAGHRLVVLRGELTGKRLSQVIAEPEQVVIDYLLTCSRTRNFVPATFTLIRSDGECLPCRVEGALFRPRTADRAAVLLLRLTIKRDVPSQFAVLTQQVQVLNREIARRQRTELELRRQQQWFRVTLSSIGDGVIATDKQGCVLFMNPVAETLTGWTQNQALGKPMEQVFHIVNETSRERVENPVARVLLDGRTVGLANHTLLLSRSGREWPIADSAAPIQDDDGNILGVVLVFLEITERKRVETQLRQQTQDLIAADRRKDEYLAMLAHELRNPLGAVSNALHLMKCAPPDSAAYQRAHGVAARQVQQQIRMMDDLLDVSRFTRGTFSLHSEPLSLAELCCQTIEDCRVAFEEEGISLSLALPEQSVWVLGDPVRLTQVLVNLLNNARKFTPEGGSVQVRLAIEDARERALLTVTDTGSGIDRELLPRVFEAFCQGEQTLARTSGGLGLGLALVQGIVELHGGSVAAKSPGIGQGATISIELPLASSPTHARAPAFRLRARTTLQVLIIEDNQDAAETMRDLVEFWGHRVEVALSGTAGVQTAEVLGPDVVLCDIGLPGIDGYEVGRRLRRSRETAKSFLVAITGYGQAQDRARTAEAGFDCHLVKPVDMQELEALLALTKNRRLDTDAE